MSSDTLQPGTGYEHWLIKFRTETDQRDAGCIEEAYPDGESGWHRDAATRTFDTKAGRFFGVHALIGRRRLADPHPYLRRHGELQFSSSNRDYREFIGVVFEVTKDFQQVEQAFRRAAFNVLAHNAMIM